MPDVDPSRHATEVPSPGRRALIFAVAVVFLVHSVLVMVWVMPENPIREAIGPGRLERYINNDVVPFEQNWSVFAPVPRRAGETVQVRTRFEASRAATDWFDITADEDERVRGLVNPSRVHAVTRRLGGSVNGMLANFNDEQRKIVTMDVESRSGLAAKLREAGRGNPRDNVTYYLLVDEMLTRFGSMYATARWGDDIEAVQFRIGNRRVPAFERRDRVELSDVPYTYRTLGWRPVMPGDVDAQEVFDDYVERVATGVDR
jgi:hypothetical protein